MAIKLIVKKYCDHCTDFEPEVIKDIIRDPDDTPYFVETRVMCEHRNKCENIYGYFKKEKSCGEKK